SDPNSFNYFLHFHLIKHLRHQEKNLHLLRGDVKDLEVLAREIEEKIKSVGGIDLQILGIGKNGHIGFNEPGSSLGSRTRPKTLTEQTRRDNARFFTGVDEVPRHVITQGLGTICDARHLVLIATGGHKAEAVAAAVEGPLTA